MDFARRLPLLVLCAAFALGACQQQAPAAPDSMASEAAGAPEAKPGLSVKDGMLTLPAVKGNPGAAYFTLFNGGDKPAVLAAASIEGSGKVEFHQTSGGTMAAIDQLEIAPGAAITLAPGGMHAMAFDLGEGLTAGGTAELTLTFADGDKLSVPLKVVSVGNAPMGDMH